MSSKPSTITVTSNAVTDLYDFTKPELEVVTGYLTQIAELEKQMAQRKEFVSVFLGFIQESQELPSLNGRVWVLQISPEGRPFMQSVAKSK
jgi:hypothetical protein